MGRQLLVKLVLEKELQASEDYLKRLVMALIHQGDSVKAILKNPILEGHYL